MEFEKLWPQPLHTDRWCADLRVTFCMYGKADQNVRLTNFSSSAVRIDGANGLLEGGKAWLEIGDHARIPVCIVWVADTVAGCRFVGRVDPDVFQTIAAAATSIDRTVITSPRCSVPAKRAGCEPDDP